jgi:hypothetical protein
MATTAVTKINIIIIINRFYCSHQLPLRYYKMMAMALTHCTIDLDS